MPVDIILGAQWGDEGKGKIVDHLCESASIVARYQGGANAGHTVIVKGKTEVLHQIPSGIFHPKITCVIGNGVVVDPVALLDEARRLEALKIRISGRLFISHHAHLIMPYHKLFDRLAEEAAVPEGKIGTTGRGIGPAYMDKFARTGIRIVDLLDRDRFRATVSKRLVEKNLILKNLYGSDQLDADAITNEYLHFDRVIDPYVTDTSLLLTEALKKGKTIIAEGAQGALLDIDHGTYPFVTSSNPTAGGACTGLGIPPTSVRSIMGVVKAYTTRVGSGPFPTEDSGEIGALLRSRGGEFGATTGRPRRCGWFDAVAAQYVVRMNGIDRLAVTKLDVLDEFDEILVCTGYKYQGSLLKTFHTETPVLERVEPVYEHFKGWKSSTRRIKFFRDLPLNARRYLHSIEELSGSRLAFVSVGPGRNETIKVGK